MKKIRVCQIITRLVRGGAPKVALKLLANLDSSRFESFLIAGTQTGKEGSIFDEANALRVEKVFIRELVRDVDLVNDSIATVRIAATLSKIRPDVVHCHTYKAGVMGSIVAKLVGTSAVIFTPHGHIFEDDANIPGVPSSGLSRFWLYWLTKFAGSCADKVTALSELDMESQLMLNLAPHEKYCVVRNGVDMSEFGEIDAAEIDAFKKLYGITGKSPVIGVIGRLTLEKGHNFLIEAMAKIKGVCPNVILLMVGTGNLKDKLLESAEKLNLGDSVKFLGELPSTKIMLSAIDVFVQPSLYESQGMAILEAMAAQKPVVATDVGGVADVVIDGETGLLVPSRSPAALAFAIIKILKEPALAKHFTRKAYQRVATDYSIDKMVANYEKLYLKLLRL